MSTTTRTTLQQTRTLGQSIWYDNIRRGLIASGELQALIDQGVLGITSNPTIFEKAISASDDYDAALRALVAEGRGTTEIYESLAVDDIRAACDLLLPVFRETSGVDGRVSLEVLPALAANTEQTISEGLRLHQLVGRPNVMIKVPATPEGLLAITALTGAGVSVNVTLIFGLDQYREVLDAYIDGVEQRLAAGGGLDGLASVASFFVSRVDSACDKLLAEKAKSGTPDERARAEGLMGKVAIANAKLAYDQFHKVSESARWKGLAARGARPQRLLWASTGTKDPRYSDTLYLDGLIGDATVNTVPPATLAAYLDHGRPALTLGVGLPEAAAQIAALTALDIDVDRVCRGLLSEGVKSFLASMNTLLSVIGSRRAAIAEQMAGRQTMALSAADRVAVQTTVAQLAATKAPERIWAGDATLFTPDPAHEKSIHNRLGWLRSPELMRGKRGELEAFAAEVRAAGFKRVVLLGMGGSSLCPEVLAHSFRGTATRTTPALSLDVLDNTDPAAVRAVENAGDLASTLFVVSSKSGGTIEIQAFERYFWDRVLTLRGGDVARAGSQFVAITDPVTRLGALAEEKHYRHIFVNPADIGGRYSAVSYFGLVPAALLGIDIAGLVDSAAAMASGSSAHVPAHEMVGLELGAILGTLLARGRDKLTLITDPELETLGSWIEQLVAESTGKEGKGIVPIDLEPLGAPDVYGPDRLFVRTSLGDGDRNSKQRDAVAALERAGFPVVRLVVPAREDLGREFFRWELATAIAGSLMGVNPFDEPNVTEAKVATAALLALQQQQGKLPDAEGVFAPSDGEAIRHHLKSAGAGDYVAFCAYFPRTEARDGLLSRLRVSARQKTGCATTLGYGPRFLHSTGQLHKGGANNGVFLQLTADGDGDLAIPGEAYSFGSLRDAQALGDLQVLRRRGRRAIRIHLGKDVEGGLEQLLAVLAGP